MLDSFLYNGLADDAAASRALAEVNNALVRFAIEHFRSVAAEYEGVLKEAAADPLLGPVFTRLRDEAKAHGAKLEKFLPAWKEPPKEARPVEGRPGA